MNGLSMLLKPTRIHPQKTYKIKGLLDLPSYSSFTELLSYPLDDGVEPSDVTCRILDCKYDWFRLERIAGTDAAAGLIKGT
ncbi:hypothetical protein M378DRAFT_172350 [Amanita muscaria Koide BX008]|uniref:Uncharacterized protein n=1 Tax=Amanita muscaria (strain Koide BX008) TaxID=946122 RepID=A0A0C2SS23_AMAMK|nr:hypothetical protein M378DRAFT_172350 [Amanita muscaria Koide BX008]